ncbi:MAG: hypothetical protein FWG56_01265 [Desulfovibrionaceae bacterium]|jgi:hypothetical protein|nr:hypothetical protein [Desulfovibrionaceae bacterium]
MSLEQGLSIEQTAAAIGRSVGATCTMRTRFMAMREGRRRLHDAKASRAIAPRHRYKKKRACSMKS